MKGVEAWKQTKKHESKTISRVIKVKDILYHF